MPNILPFHTPQVSVPVGVIEIWTGTIATIPEGWRLCDGLNGTPNLLDKFIRGTPDAVTEVGTLGGLVNITLTILEMALHSHGITEVPHSHSSNQGTTDASSSGISEGGSGNFPTGFQFFTRLTPVNANIGNTGGGTSHNNMPPFFEVAYIIKV